MAASNPFFELPYASALESLGDAFYDRVQPAAFPQPILRFRNDELLIQLGLNPKQVTDAHFLEAFGEFQASPPPFVGLALRYHGHQFGQYNPYLGDGRGFLYGQVRTPTGQLLDLGTKGSGPTPHSQGRDGRMSLRGGVREVLAAEALHRLGISTSRVLCLIETGEVITRENEATPTRCAIMVRLSQSHIRFGTFERLEYYDRGDCVRQLLDYVVQHYYTHLWKQPDQDLHFYAALVQRTAQLVAQWMAAGFCHGVLNTDNMSITGEGFDYGPYAFIGSYLPYFTPASFDRWGRYSYRNQPRICRWNLAMLQRPLALVMPQSELEAILESFTAEYEQVYQQAMLRKLGFDDLPEADAAMLIRVTVEFLFITQVGYHQFFGELRRQFSSQWQKNPALIFADCRFLNAEEQAIALNPWRRVYHRLLQEQPETEMVAIAERLTAHNPQQVPLQSMIKEVWAAIVQADDWHPFDKLLTHLKLNG